VHQKRACSTRWVRLTDTHHLSCKPMSYGRSGGCVAGRRRRKGLVCQPIAGCSGLDARLHAQQGGVTSIGDVPWRAQVSVGAYPSFAKVRATIQESNDARSLGDAPSRNSSRDCNGTLAAYCRVTPVEQNQNEKEKDTVSGPGITKEVGGIHVRLTHSLFASDIPRRLLRRVSLAKPTSAPLLC
jgi:hypothetical protein